MPKGKGQEKVQCIIECIQSLLFEELKPCLKKEAHACIVIPNFLSNAIRCWLGIVRIFSFYTGQQGMIIFYTKNKNQFCSKPSSNIQQYVFTMSLRFNQSVRCLGKTFFFHTIDFLFCLHGTCKKLVDSALLLVADICNQTRGGRR